ncbi:MAG TPA: TonB-dependent receptor plug domain-containing protein [Longimicrobiales bacterium]|nr:TonB-dependent receptor plug domain-containing protein [Longimicrobiales bacterium]
MISRQRLAPGLLTALIGVSWVVALDAQAQMALHDNRVRATPLLERPAELSVRDVTLDAALVRLTETSGVIVVFSPSLLRADYRTVTCDCERATVGEALDRLLAGTRFAHTEIGGQIALIPRPMSLRPALSGQVTFASYGAPAHAGQLRPVVTLRDPLRPLAIQVRAIQGVVVDQMSGSPLQGAAVTVEGTSVVTTTSRDGRFSLSYTPGTEFTLVVSMLGFRERRQVLAPTDDLSNLRIALTPDPFQSEAIVVTGIASSRSRSRAEVSVARVSAEELSAQQLYTSIDQLVAGKISGVQLHPAAGYAGGGYRFFVRGGGGLNGDGQPLIIVDGVRIDDSNLNLLWNGGQGYSNLLSLSPSEIETIEVLKGPAAAAMYGTNASNGVVLITTKGGHGVGAESGVAFNYKLSYGQNTMPFDYDPALYRNAGLYNNLLRSGTIQEHNIDASGGSGLFRYFFAYQNKSEEGVTPRNHHTRNSARANVTAAPNDRFSISVNAGFSGNDIERPHSDDAVLSPHWNTIMVDRAWKWYDSTAIASTIAPARNNRTTGTTQVTWNVGRGFDLFGSAGVDYSYHRQDEFYPPEFAYWMGFGGRRRIAERSNTQYTYDFRGSYSYEPVPELFVTSVVGSQMFDREVTSMGVENRQFATGLISEISSGSDYRGMWEGKFQERQAGIYTTNTASYQDRYFATLSLRQDFASAVGEDAPTIIYPQASFAVRLDQFDILPDLFNIFKLRAAYGESGQLPGPRDTKRLLWGAMGTALGPGAIPTQMGNPALEPERIRELELGLDTEIANRWSLETTYFRQNAENSIIGRPNAPSTGFGNIIIPYNIGKARAHGIEAALGGDVIRTERYGLGFNLIWNWQANEVVDLGGEGPIIANYQVNAIAEGMPKHEYYAVVTTGARFDEDGRYIGVEESDGRVRLGNPIPDHTGSFALNFRFLRDFTLNGMADWGLGKQVFSIFRQFAARNGGYIPFAEMAARLGLDDEWGWITSVDWDAIEPLTPGTPEYTELAHEFARMDPFYRGNYIFDADYFVLRELSLSYDATELLARYTPLGSRVRGMTLGVAAKNILRRSQYHDGDFEVNADGARSTAWGIDYGTVPPPRVMNFWVNVSF